MSMGWAAARKLRTSLQNLGRILAVELTCAAHGLDLRAPLQPGPGARGRARRRARAHRRPGRRPPARARSRRGRGARRRGRGAGRGRGGRGGDGVSREIRAPHGSELSCKGWPQEAVLRMLMNNLDPDVAERPEDLVVYGGTGRAARSWEAYDAIVASLRDLEGDETLLVQSGKPVGVMRTHEWAPRVLIANSNLVPEWATWDEFRRLEDLGLTMYGQMTAGSWIYIGTQGIVQGTYECFAEIARRRHGGSLAGTITLTAGLGGMGGAQPLAVTMNDGVVLCVEVDAHRIRRRLETRYLDEQADDLDDAVARCRAAEGGGARAERRPRGQRRGGAERAARVRLRGRHRHRPDERARPARRLRAGPHDAGGGRAPADRGHRRVRPPRARRDGRPLRRDGRLPGPRRRGLRLRELAARGGEARRLRARVRLPGLRARLRAAAVLRGQGPVPLGRALGRPGRHPRDRPRGARGVPRRRAARPLDPPRRGADRLPGPARPASAGSATASARGSGCASTRWCARASCRRRS